MKNEIIDNPNVEVTAINKSKDKEIRFDASKLHDTMFKRMLLYNDSVTVAPLEYLLTGQIVTMSGAIGKHVRYHITESISIYLNCWAVVIGKSSIMKKTTAINKVKEDLQRIDSNAVETFQKEFEEYQKAKILAEKEKITCKVKEPKRGYLIFPNDATVEALGIILSTSSRGLLAHSEFGSFLAQLNRSYAGDGKQLLTTIYDVPESYEISRAAKASTYLKSPYLSILGASTIDWIQQHSSASDLRSGFFARMLFSVRNVADKEYIPLLRLSELTRQNEKHVDSRSLYEFLTNYDGMDTFTIDDDAREFHVNWDSRSYMELLDIENESELSFKARLLIYSLKFAGLIALSERRTNVTIEDMRDAVHITQYFKANVELLLNDEMMKDEFSRQEERIKVVIKRFGGEISRRDLMQQTKIKKYELDPLLQNLEEKGEVFHDKKKSNPNSKPAIIYKLQDVI